MDREGFRNRLKQYKKAREESPGLKYWEWKDIPKYEDGTGNVEKQDNTRVASIEKEQVFIPATGELKRKQELLNKLSRNGQIKSGAIDIVSPEYDLLTGVRAITTLPTKAEKLGRKIFNSNFISDDEITDLINSKRISDLTTFTKKIKNDSDWYVHTDLGKSNSVFAGNGKGAYIQDRHLHPGEALIFDQKPYAWWNRGKRYARLGENEDGYLAIIIKGSNAKDLLQVNKSQNPIGQWNGKSGFVLQSEYVTQQPVNLTPDIEHYIYDGLTKTYGNVKHYKDGGEVTGPPTYEDWLKSLIKNNLWMHPDYYMSHSLNTATKALKLASAKLPGREDMPPVPVPAEIKGEFPQEWVMNNLYNVENPRKKGVTKKYAKMYDSRTLGAGVDVVSGHPELYDKAKRFGIEKELADEIAYEHIVHDDQVIRDNYADIYGKAAADTLSFGPRFLVAQARYQLGNVRKGWDEIHKALAKGDAKALKKAVLKVTPEDHDYRKKWVKNFNVYDNEPE